MRHLIIGPLLNRDPTQESGGNHKSDQVTNITGNEMIITVSRYLPGTLLSVSLIVYWWYRYQWLDLAGTDIVQTTLEVSTHERYRCLCFDGIAITWLLLLQMASIYSRVKQTLNCSYWVNHLSKKNLCSGYIRILSNNWICCPSYIRISGLFSL